MNNIQKSLCQNVENDYTPIFGWVMKEDKDVFLPTTSAHTCRFCGKTEPEVTFLKRAHAVSELCGNHHLLSECECDDCNGKFSKFEKEFSQMMLFLHTMLQVKGKKNNPKFQPDRNGKSYIEIVDGQINIHQYDGEDPLVTIDEKNQEARLNGVRNYIPIDAYKCLIKMALTVMPERELDNLQDILTFLNTGERLPVKPMCHLRIYNAFNAHKYPAAFIYKRKETCTKQLPAYLFALAYNDFFFQMVIPSMKLDERLEGVSRIDLPVIPSICDGEYRIIYREYLDLSSDIKQMKQSIPLNMKFDGYKMEDYLTGEVKEIPPSKDWSNQS